MLSVATGSLTASAVVSPGATTRVSVAENGTQQGPLESFFYFGAQHPSMSGNGLNVAYDTQFPLDPIDADNDHNAGSSVPAAHENDVYVRDRIGNHTVLISRGTPSIIFLAATAAASVNGEDGANGDSTDPSISANGRYVAFRTSATNINTVNGVTPGPDPQHTEIVICDRDPDNNGVLDEHQNGDPNQPMLYTYTVVSQVTTEVGPDPNPDDPFPGPTLRTNSASQPSLTTGNGFGEVAWVENVTTGNPPPPARVRVTHFALGTHGEVLPNSLQFVTPSPGRVVRGAQAARAPAISRDGSHVAYEVAYNFTDSAGAFHFGRAVADAALTFGIPDNCEGAFCVVDQTRLDIASLDAAGNPVFLTGSAFDPTLTANGRKVAFSESDTNSAIYLLDRDPDGNGQLWTPDNGEPGPATSIVSRNNDGEVASGTQPWLTPDGRYLSFTTSEANMHNGFDDTSNGNPCNNSDFAAAAAASSCADVVVRDLTVDDQRAAASLPQTRLKGELASPSTTNDCGSTATPPDSCEGDGFSSSSSLADDGSAVAYESGADDLVGKPDGPNPDGDSNFVDDVFVRDFRPTVTGEAVDFGAVDLGSSSTQTAPVRQVGFGPVTVGEAVISTDQDHNDFTVVFNCVGTTIHEDETCGILVRYTPSVTGERHATLTVTPAGRAPVQIAVTGGVGVPPDGFTATPNPLPFAPARLALSRSGPGIVTIRNLGRLPFVIDSLTRPGGTKVFQNDYVVTQDNCLHQRLAGGGIGSCTITVVFTPHGSGQRNGALQVNTIQDGTTPTVPHVIGLTGSGVAPALQVNPGVVPSGRVTSITGLGFAPNHPVVLTIEGMPGTLTATTLADGTFGIPFIVFPHSTTGTHTVTATVPGTTLKATAPVLITLGSGQPPGFEIRR